MKTKQLLFLCTASIFALSSGLNAQKSDKKKIDQISAADTTVVNKKEEKNRNVMLNAESNIGPRNVNIGLPFTGDVVILENNIPVVYYFYPSLPTSVWRMDNSLSKMGLMSFAEGAITTGKVGYAVQSSDRDASSTLKGYGSVYVNSFGASKYDLTLTGPINKKGLGFMLDLYQSFDRANGVNYQFTPWADKTTMIKFALQKKYANGNVRLLYKYADSKQILTNYSPLTYNGDGKTSPLSNFKLGTDSYVLGSGMIPYYDYNTGTPQIADLSSDKYTRSIAHNMYLTGEHDFKSGWKLTYSSMFQHMTAPLVVTFPLSIGIYDPTQAAAAGWKFKYAGTSNDYTGSAQMVASQVIPTSIADALMSRAELTKKIKGHDLRFGLNQIYNHRKFSTNAGLYFQTVEANPKILDMYSYYKPYNIWAKATNNGLMPLSAGGYGGSTDETYNKLALYITDDIKINKRLDIGLGIRLEDQNIHDNQNSHINDTLNNRPLISKDFSNRLNKVVALNTVYKITKEFGVLGDATYNSWWERYWDYGFRDANGNPIADPTTPKAKPLQTVPKEFQTNVLNVGGGIFHNLGSTLSLVSKLTYISKQNIRASQSVTNAAGTERTTFDPIIYDLSTLGWTTDIMATPIKNFNIHYLLTLQAPKYKNYSYSAYGTTYDYNNKYIPELSGVLMEIDPAYSFDNGIRVWASMRYFGKQYGNPTNVFTYNGWWENFGGVDYRVSRNVNLKFQVTNFLNQQGVKGKLQGADQILDASSYVGKTIVAGGIRPRTFELTCQYKF
jgi:hypothetical protein